MKKHSSESLLLSLSSALLTLGLVACGGGGGGGSSTPVGQASPAQFAPSDPGLLSIGPLGLTLEIGQSETLQAELFDSLGIGVDSADVTWSTENPEIISMQADGSIEAMSVGPAVVTASDAGRRVASMILDVVEAGAAPEGPVAAKFMSPILVMDVGAMNSPLYEFTDARGEIIFDPIPMSRLVSDSDRIEIDPANGTIAALSEGLALVNMVLVDGMGQETPLLGQLVVLVLDQNAATRPPEECEWTIVEGIYDRPPVFYSRPDLGAELRSLVYERLYCNNGISGLEMRVRQMAPRSATIADRRVASFNAQGLLESHAAGQTMVEGLLVNESGSELPIPGFMLTVLPDLGGTWHLKAPNGDTGRIEMPAAPILVERQRATRDPQTGNRLPQAGDFGIMSPRVPLTGDSVLLDSNGIQVCKDPARFNVSFLSLVGGGSGICTEDNRGRLSVFSTKLITYCGDSRHPNPFTSTSQVVEWHCTGPATLRGSNGVELSREAPPPVNMDEFGSVMVNGVLLQDSNPLVTRNALGELLLTFFTNGNEDDFGIGISLAGISQPGQYMLSNVGGFDADDSNWVLYGRFEPETAWSTGPNHVVMIDVQQIDDEVLQATFNGQLMDLDLAGTGAKADVLLENGRFRAEIENLESSFGAFELDGLRIEDPLAYAERGDGELYIDIEQDAGAAIDPWCLEIILPAGIAPGTYVANRDIGAFTVEVSREGPPPEFFVTGNGHQVTVTLTAVNNQRVRGTFSGTVGMGDATRRITNGEFDIAIEQ